jgi:hypothetical protein
LKNHSHQLGNQVQTLTDQRARNRKPLLMLWSES